MLYGMALDCYQPFPLGINLSNNNVQAEAEESEPGWEMLEGGSGGAAGAGGGPVATGTAAAETETGLDASAAVDEAENQT